MTLTNGYRYKFSLVVCARWEETDILEWVNTTTPSGLTISMSI